MRVSLYDIVAALVQDNDVSEVEIIDTIQLLLDDSICQKRSTVFKVGKMVQGMVDYEKAPVA